jgi:hypothetical protein
VDEGPDLAEFLGIDLGERSVRHVAMEAVGEPVTPAVEEDVHGRGPVPDPEPVRDAPLVVDVVVEAGLEVAVREDLLEADPLECAVLFLRPGGLHRCSSGSDVGPDARWGLRPRFVQPRVDRPAHDLGDAEARPLRRPPEQIRLTVGDMEIRPLHASHGTTLHTAARPVNRSGR